MKNVLIHYFSGTGNTYHMIKKIGEKLVDKGYEVSYSNIESEAVQLKNNFSIHLFSYPIYAFGTPSLVLKYLKKLKPGNGSKAAILCTGYELEGQSLRHVSKILKKKDYDVFLQDLVIYPQNWTQILNPIDEKTQENVLKDMDTKLTILSNKIINFEKSTKKCSLFNLIWSWIIFILFRTIGRRILGKSYIADKNCTSCGICERVCPVNSIHITKGKPNWNWQCENCQRCINICPTKAIQNSPLRLIMLICSETAMLLLLIAFNQYYKLNLLLNILLYLLIFLLITFLMDKFMNLLMKVPIFRKLFEMSYTKDYSRYMVKDFKKIINRKK